MGGPIVCRAPTMTPADLSARHQAERAKQFLKLHRALFQLVFAVGHWKYGT
jgi:hypothetical protein